MIMGFVGRGAPRHGLTRDAKSNQWGEVIAYSFQHSIDSWRLSHPRVLANFQCFFGNERPKPNVNHYAKTLEPKIKKEDRRSERNDESISTIQTQAGRAGIERHKSCLRSRSAYADCVKVRGLKVASAFRRWIRALKTRATTREKVVAQNRVDRVEAVLPADFFPFVISPAVVGNAYFVNAGLCFRQFRHHLRFKSKAIFPKIGTLHQRRAERFVAGLKIGQVQIRKHVREERQKSVPDHVPKIKHSMRVASHKTRTQS